MHWRPQGPLSRDPEETRSKSCTEITNKTNRKSEIRNQLHNFVTMLLIDLHLFKFRFFDVVDIVIVAIIIYQLYNLIRGTIAANIFIGMALICLLYFVVRALEMPLLTR